MGKEKKEKEHKRKRDYDETDVPKVLKGPVDTTPKVICKNCNKEIDTSSQPEVSMGAINCPECNATIDQKGEVLSASKPLAGQPLRARRDYGESPQPSDAAMVKDIPMDVSPPPLPIEVKDYDSPPPPCGCLGTPASPISPTDMPHEVSEEVVMPSDEGIVTILVCPDCGTEGPFDMNPPPGIDPLKRKLKCARCKTIIPLNTISKTASNKYEVKTAHCMDSQFKTIKNLVKPGELSSANADKILEALDKIYKKYLELEKA
jgi:hypothetical protein